MNKTLKFLSVPLAVTVIFGTLLSSYNVSADDTVDEINITVPVSCSLSGSGMDSHNTEINNGQSNSSIGETTMKVFCNDNNGFAIYAIGYTDNTDGKNVLTSSTLGSTHDIVTGTATSGDTSNWAMKLSTVTDPAPTYPIVIAGSSADTDKEQGDPDYSTFQAVPDDYALVAKRTSNTDIGASAEGSTIKSTYQAYISKTQPAGTYTGQVKYTLVHPNDGAAPTKPISIESAMQTAGKTRQNGYYKMQDLNNTICSTVNIIEADGMTELIDVRDNHVYKVTKLKDNRCWLLENLALDPTNPTTAANMSADNTNATTATIYNYLNGGNPDDIDGWSSVAVTDVDTGFDSHTAPMINNASKDTLVTSYGPASENGQSRVGIYYNYCAATIGTYCYSSMSGTINTYEDICPTGWRMPTGGVNGEYVALYNEYNTTQDASNLTSLQWNFSTPMSGSYNGSSERYQNENGNWWSSSVNSGLTTMLITNSNLVISIPSQRGLGASVRCLVSN